MADWTMTRLNLHYRGAMVLLWMRVFLLVLSLLPALARAATLEIPGSNTTVSGIGVISGWKCDAGDLTIRFDNGPAIPLVYGSERGDTRSVCGDANNGYLAIMNWNLLEQGFHEATVYDDGREFARTFFTVVTPGVEFLRGVTGSGTVTLSNGQQATLAWSEAQQGFVVTEFHAAETTGPAGFDPYFDPQWTGLSPEAVRAKLEPTYWLLLDVFGVTETNYPLYLYRRSDHPSISIGGFHGETVLTIGLAVASSDQGLQYTYQFSHELTHALTNSELSAEWSWFDETLAEMGSLYVLETFAEQTPYPEVTEQEWAGYVEDLVAGWWLRAGLWRGVKVQPCPSCKWELAPVASWFSEHEAALLADPYIRELNAVMAQELLPFFQANPALWQACGVLNLWNTSAHTTFADFLDAWQTILIREGESTEIIPVLRRVFYGE